MVNLIWNEEDAKKSYIEQGREEGLEQGMAQGLEQGMAQGLEQGMAQGMAKGKSESLLESIRNLMKNLDLTAEAAMNALGVSSEKQKELAPLI